MLRKTTSLLLVVCLLLTCMTQGIFAAAQPTGVQFSDVSQNHWAANHIQRWSERGILNGNVDKTFNPEGNLTMAQLCAIINNIFGYSAESSENFKDVKPASWYKSVALKAKAAGYINKLRNSDFNANSPVTREEVSVALYNAFKLQKADTAAILSGYSDLKDYKGANGDEIAAVIESKFLTGYPTDKTFKPASKITRAEFAQVLSNVLGELYNSSGTYSAAELKGNVIINKSDVTLKDTVISGNIYLSEGIGEGDVTLDNVTVKGKTFINGGGQNSIHLIASSFSDIIVDKENGNIRLISKDNKITTIIAKSGIKIEIDKESKESLPSIVIDSDTEAGQVIEIAGNVGSIVCNSPGTTINIAKGSVVNSLVLSETATGAALTVEGKILKTEIGAADVKVNNTSIQKGAKGEINGETGQLPNNGGTGTTGGSSSSPQLQKLAAPVFSPAAGQFDYSQAVTISSITADATIRFTTDGTAPTASSQVYTEPINLTENTTLRAIAVKSGMADSDVTTAVYIIRQQIDTPSFSLPAGTYDSSLQINLNCRTENVGYRYTTDGTVPDSSSPEYTGGIAISESTTVQAIAVKAGMIDSDVITASYIIDTPDTDPWELVWNDEFDGTTLSTGETGKWILENKGDGFGNNEEQFYKPDNATVENGKLVITAKKESYSGKNYTSAKLFSNANWKYGKFEAKIKMPLGQGFWPAFWMMPQDGVYGGWAASGEIDIMEAKGRIPGSTSGTLHYGGAWPNNKYTGADQLFPEGQNISGEHVYALEWEPGEIRWYIDGKLFQVQNNWNTNGINGEEKYSFPAPFDQNFYLMFNLAIGGNFDGGLIPDASLFPARMEVDYVRVYSLEGRDYKTPVEPAVQKEPLPRGAKTPSGEGGLVSDINFENGIKDNAAGDDSKYGEGWNYVHGETFGGSATATVEEIDGKNYAKIGINDNGGGNAVHSIQLEQLTTLGKGRWYKYSFDAKAEAARTLNTKIGGGAGAGWAVYSDTYTESLSTDFRHFEHIFQMNRDSDIKTRIELNCGLSDIDLWIGNVKLEEIDAPQTDYNASKPELSSSRNNIYNGTFDKYTLDRMAYWNTAINGAEASISVPEATRELTAIINNGGTSPEAITVDQRGIQLVQGNEYSLSFKARATGARNITARVVSKDGSKNYLAGQEFALTTAMQEFTVPFEMTQANDPEAKLEILLGGNTEDVYIDDVSLAQKIDVDYYPIKNGDFALGYTLWEPFQQDAAADFSIENGAAKINITNVGTQSWNVMLNQGNMLLRSGFTYELSFDAKASVERDMDVSVENASYTRRLDQQRVALGLTTQHYEYDFSISADELLALKFILGKTVDAAAGTVYIDNVVLKVKGTTLNMPPLLIADSTDNKVEHPIDITFNDIPAWREGITAVKVDRTPLSANQYSVTAGKITIADSVLTEVKSYVISIESTGYANTNVTQAVGENILAAPALTADATNNKVGQNIAIGFNDDEAWRTAITAVKIGGVAVAPEAITITSGLISIDAGAFTRDGNYTITVEASRYANATVVQKVFAADGNLILNGDMSDGINNWSLYTADGSNAALNVSGGALDVNFSGYDGWFQWSTQVYQDNVPFVAGKTYVLSFDIKSTIEKPIIVDIEKTADFNIKYLQATVITPAAISTPYSYEFTVNANETNAKVLFQLGSNNVDGDHFTSHVITIGNVRLEEKE